MEEILRRNALEYHLRPPPGKISVTPTKSLVNQRDLALAYTPGVAAACEEIVRDPGPGADPCARTGTGDRWRDAWRCGAQRPVAACRFPALAAEGGSEPSDHADAGR